MIFRFSVCVIASTLISQSLAAALPWYNDPFSTLEPRFDDDVSSWKPTPDAPDPLPGQSFTDYMNTILGGVGEPKNEHDPKAKREYMEYPGLSVTYWEDETGRFNLSTVDPSCTSGVKPHYLAGDLVKRDRINGGTYILPNANVSDIYRELYAIRLENKRNTEKREQGWADFLHINANATYEVAEEEVNDGLIQNPTPLAAGETVHTELRKLLDIGLLPYYAIMLSGSIGAGALIGGVQAGIVHATSEVELGWENWLVSAVGYALAIIAATEFSRFAPRISQAGIWSPVVIFVWAKKKIQDGRKARALARATGAGVGTAAGGATNAIQNSGTVTPQQAADHLSNLAELGQAGAEHGLTSISESQNILHGETSTNQCRG